jgi:hypothetical protein
MFRHLSVSQGLTLMVALLFGFLFAGSAQIDAQENAPIAFTILGPDGVVARVITTAAQCPEITIDGTTSAMQLRAAPDADFPVTVCDAAIAPDAKSASVDGQALKLPKAKPERIVVVGDTGCRLKGDRSQSCNDPAAWPLARIADNAAKANPDLVIHVGDYHYRESPCVVDKANCAGSPYGDNWASWNADLIAPARSLLQAAPWVMVRGNHEDCQRAGGGYFRLLDPRPLPASCPAYTDPYAISYVEPQLILADDSAVNDFQVEPEQLDTYKKQFEQINAQAARAPTWLLLHDPMYVFGHAGEKDGKEQLFQDQPTLQQASNNAFPETVQAFISGHIHLFEVLSFEQGRPPQLVVGNGGTQLDPPITTLLQGLDIAGMQVAEGKMLDQFGFVVMDRSGAQWALGVKNASGGDMDKCILGGGKLLCGQTALPVGGGEMPNQIWLALALFGASIIVIGLALRARAAGHHTRAEQDAQ